MFETNKILLLSVVEVLFICTVLCADPFESFIVRLDCYKGRQPGCNKDFIKEYPEVAWSHNKMTPADTYFYLFTNRNPDVPELLHKCPGTLPPMSKFNCDCPTEIFIPGFVSGICNFAIYRELKNARLKSGCYNVILVDYMWGNIPDLVEAKANLHIVAKQLAILIRNIKQKCMNNPYFILTGHSYGSHLAGFVGQQEPIGCILGIDPAGGLFNKDTPLDGRLDAGDADHVQVWHCNAGDCLPNYFGINVTCGTIDFWINGGSYQPSCYNQTMKAFVKQDYIYGTLSLFPPACNHFQCLQYYRASMNPTECPFVGRQCESYEDLKSNRCPDCGNGGENCQMMGIEACKCLAKNKTYYMDTENECPYCDKSRQWERLGAPTCNL